MAHPAALLAALSLSTLSAQMTPAAEIDPRLVGTYRYTHAYTSGTFTAVFEQTMTLRADGTCEIAANSGAGNASTSIGPRRKPQITHRGTWSVEGKTLTLKWQKGKPERLHFLYGKTSSGWSLLLRTPGGAKKLWSKIR